VPNGTRAPKELLHHLPALELRRPCVSACPSGGERVVRGSRLLDLRPPHYRCPAVPGLSVSARAILMMLSSSVLPSGITHCELRQWPFAGPLFGSQPRRPTCAFPDLEPHCRTSRCARPQPTPSPRYCPLNFTAVTCTCVPLLRFLRSCSWRPLITAGHPVRSSVPSPSCTSSGFGTPLPHRPAHCTCGYCCPAVRFCQALLSFWLREKP
jgi:hypothetical protein